MIKCKCCNWRLAQISSAGIDETKAHFNARRLAKLCFIHFSALDILEQEVYLELSKNDVFEML